MNLVCLVQADKIDHQREFDSKRDVPNTSRFCFAPLAGIHEGMRVRTHEGARVRIHEYAGERRPEGTGALVCVGCGHVCAMVHRHVCKGRIGTCVRDA